MQLPDSHGVQIRWSQTRSQTGSDATRSGGVGVEAPPSSSSVTATTSPSSTVPSNELGMAFAGEEPGRRRHVAFDHPHLVGLSGGRWFEPGELEHRTAVGSDDQATLSGRERDRLRLRVGDDARLLRAAARVRCACRRGRPRAESPRSRSRRPPRRQLPRGWPPQGAPTARERGDSKGTTTWGSARTCARTRSRRSGLGAGPEAATASASVTPANDASSSWHGSQERRCASYASRSLGLERVERVGSGQLVNSGLHDPSCADSSRSSRRRASPANIRLLIVPRGTPSLSASSDCEYPP